MKTKLDPYIKGDVNVSNAFACIEDFCSAKLSEDPLDTETIYYLVNAEALQWLDVRACCKAAVFEAFLKPLLNLDHSLAANYIEELKKVKVEPKVTFSKSTPNSTVTSSANNNISSSSVSYPRPATLWVQATERPTNSWRKN